MGIRTGSEREAELVDVVDHRTLLAAQIEATTARINDLKDKRAMLRDHLLEATVVASAAFRRDEGPTGDAMVGWVRAASAEGKRLQISGMRGAALEGLGLTLGDLSKLTWDLENSWPDGQKHGGGLCEWVDGSKWPRSGPTVYALFDCMGRLAYVGRTTNFRNRVKTHRREKGPLVAHRWEAWTCETEDEMRDLEAILIDQHQPRKNKRTEPRNGAAV